jgi:uncharacterized membrane protein
VTVDSGRADPRSFQEHTTAVETAMDFTEAMDRVSKGFEVVGVAVLVIGFVVALIRAILAYRRARDLDAGYLAMRALFGRSVLLGLEILVAADLIRTVAVQPSLENVAVLGLIVLIRTFLSFSLEVEIEGVAPWRRGKPRTVAPSVGVTGETDASIRQG